MKAFLVIVPMMMVLLAAGGCQSVYATVNVGSPVAGEVAGKDSTTKVPSLLVVNISADKRIVTTTASGTGDEAGKTFWETLGSWGTTLIPFLAGAGASSL